MNWQDILERSSLASPSQQVAGNTLTPLTHLGMLQVSGEEAAGFLQNLLTNDVRQLSTNQSHLSGFCNPKGRLFVIFQLIKLAEQNFLLILPKDLIQPMLQRLTMFKLRTKVDIKFIDGERALLGWLNPETDMALPIEVNSGTIEQEVLLIKQPGSTPRYLLIAEVDRLEHFVNTLVNPVVSHPSIWQLQDVISGIPTVVESSKEKFTPQQLNLDMIGGVSFKKGCYPGQEIVARLHYLGSPSRRMFQATLNADENIAPLTEVIDSRGEVQGHVVLSQITDNHHLTLLSIRLAAIDNELFIGSSKVEQLTALVQND